MPQTLRRPAVVVASAASLVFVGMAVSYVGDGTGTWLDTRIRFLVEEYGPPHLAVTALVVAVGEPIPVIVAAALLAVVNLARRQRLLAVLAVLGPALIAAATAALKVLIGRTIEGNLAFPSGHTAAVTALGLIGALTYLGGRNESALTAVLVAAAVTITAGSVMAVALILDEIHYPTDTIGGAALGLAVTLWLAFASDHAARWRRCRKRR